MPFVIGTLKKKKLVLRDHLEMEIRYAKKHISAADQ